MQREDKIAFGSILVVLGAVSLGVMWAVKLAGEAVFGWFASAGAGVGFKDALIAGVIASTALVALFALIAGDGIVGELPTMLVGFFILTAFFTVSIAWIF